MESSNKGCSISAEAQPKYKPSNNYARGARGRGKFVTESERPDKDLREVLNKKRQENESQHPLQMPSDPKYNFLADPMRNNDYVEPENNDLPTLNDREFIAAKYEDKNRGNHNARWNRGGRGRGSFYKSYNNYQQNTSNKNEQTAVENSEFEEPSKHAQFRGNSRHYNSYKNTGNNFSPKYSSEHSPNNESKAAETLEPKFHRNRPYRDQEHAESGENRERTRFVKGRHSFRDNSSKDEFADGQSRYRRGRHSFRENTTREQVTESDNSGRPGFRGGRNSFGDESKAQTSHEEYSARPRFDRGRRPYRGNYRGNSNRGGWNSNNKTYRKSTRDANPVNISVEFSVETGDRKCTMEQMQKQTIEKNPEIVIACEENWDEEKPITTDAIKCDD